MSTKDAVNLTPGTVLPNGAIVIAASQREAHEWIVLALSPGAAQPYVTWRCSRPGDGSDTKWGHYFASITEAVEDWRKR